MVSIIDSATNKLYKLKTIAKTATTISKVAPINAGTYVCVFEERGRGWERRLSTVSTDWKLNALLKLMYHNGLQPLVPSVSINFDYLINWCN